MDYRVGLLLRIGFLIVNTIILTAAISGSAGVFNISLLLIILIAQIVYLIKFAEKSYRQVRDFVNTIKFDDYAQMYPVKLDGSVVDELNLEFNSILKKLRNSREENEANYQYFRTIVQHLSIGIITINNSGDIQIINSSAKQLLGIQKLSNIRELKFINQTLLDTILNLRTGGNELISIKTPEGSIQLSVYIIELALRDEVFKLVSLQNIQRELEEKEMEAWQNLVRVLTHEIMNSITPISSLSATVGEELRQARSGEHVMSESDIEDFSMAIQTIQRRSEGLIRFVSDFRNLAHIPQPKITDVYIKDLLDHVAVLFSAQMEEAGITLTLHTEPESLRIAADKSLIEQVLINMVQNAMYAVKDKPEKNITLKGGMEVSGKLFISVMDNGEGIDDEALSKIFIPFFTTKKVGSGIGLSLSKQIMRRHKGNINVRSQIGEGTTFKLVFNG